MARPPASARSRRGRSGLLDDHDGGSSGSPGVEVVAAVAPLPTMVTTAAALGHIGKVVHVISSVGLRASQCVCVCVEKQLARHVLSVATVPMEVASSIVRARCWLGGCVNVLRSRSCCHNDRTTKIYC
uniref:Uncharacterized protein n=1 Tax=Arundo donax TaxID=35708 RepID=A0A0A9ALA5_ARUDO